MGCAEAVAVHTCGEPPLSLVGARRPHLCVRRCEPVEVDAHAALGHVSLYATAFVTVTPSPR